MQRGSWAPLREGDRVSLVLSVAPLAEQYFIYHSGDPRVQVRDPLGIHWGCAGDAASTF